ncbi:MAG: hypothetical protein K6E94_02205, partial [Elusimicrobiaceae bacterium]|nr:hypothetical protein [Elusimicrobiaceae bacterium]
MKKCLYFLLSILMFTQLSFAKNDCDKLIDEYFNKNYIYEGGVKGKMKLDSQRNCLNMKNPIYSDAYEFEQKQKYLLSIDDNFLVRKKLIDYQETAQIFAQNGDIENSSRYIDKFNEILIQRFDKNLAAVILKEQVQSGLISKAHQKELFEKVDKFLNKTGKCHPGVCEGYGLVSLVADAFPKCKKNSCQRNILYENLYFALANSTNNYKQANETIKTLLAKDFGTAKSNGEVKTPLLLALSYTNPDDFINYADNLLEEAKHKGLKYNDQDALLLPLAAELLITLGETDKLLSYAKAPPYNIANMEATLALLNHPLGDTIRESLRPNIEYYYEKTSACNEFSIVTAQGTETLQQSSPARFTKDPELDLFLRQRLQYAYWSDGFGSMLEHQATSGLTCVPSKYTPEDIDKFLVTSRLVKNFVKENLIDDVILLPFFAFNKIKAIAKGAKQAPKMIQVAKYSDNVIDFTQVARRAETEIDKALELSSTKIRTMPREMPYKQAVGQDFLPYYVGDNNVLKIYNSKTAQGGGRDAYKWGKYAKGTTKEKTHTAGGWHKKLAADDGEEVIKPATRRLERKKAKQPVDHLFYQDAPSWAKELGYDTSNKLAKAMGAKKWYTLRFYMSDPELIHIIKTSNPTRQKSIIARIERLFSKYNAKGNPDFSIAYLAPNGRTEILDISNIRLVHEVRRDPDYIKYMMGMPNIQHPELSY